MRSSSPWWGRPRSWIALWVAACGLVNLLEGLLPKDPEVLLWMAQFLSFEVSEHSRMLLLGAGFLQMVVSGALWRGKRNAWRISLGLLLVGPLLHLSRAWDWHHAIPQLLLAAVLVVCRGDFPARSDQPSLRRGLWIGAAGFLILTVFGVAGILSLGTAVRGDTSLSSVVQTVWELCFLQSTDTLLPATANAEVVFATISRAALALAIVLVFLALRPILLRRRSAAPAGVSALLNAHGVDPLDGFALLPDKQHFLSPSGDAVISFALWRNVAVTLGDPVGEPSAARRAIGQFCDYCARQDWRPVFYEVRGDFLEDYRAAGLRTFKVAEDARVALPGFTLSGNKFQNLRTSRNKMSKAGLRVEWMRGGGIAPELWRLLHEVSSEWLSSRGATEMTFDLGSFSEASFREAEVCVLFDTASLPVAFLTWLPYAAGRGRALDLMRHRKDHRGLMDGLIAEALLELQKRGVEEASLGNAPLANVTPGEMDTLEERALRQLFDRFDRYYGYRSLFEFKQKFRPEWRGRYVAYEGLSQLVPAMLAIVRVHLPTGLLRLLKS